MHEDKDVSEIIEAHAISCNSDMCVSAPSIDLLDRDRAFLVSLASGLVAPLCMDK